MWQTYLTVAIVAYLLGSIPFGYILVKLFLKQDIRTTGSGNIGATNVARSGKKGLAIATLLLDAGKGYFAVWLAVHYFTAFGPFSTSGSEIREAAESIFPVRGCAAFMSVIGHVFPIWLGAKGGKGVATAVGAFLVLAPRGVAVAFLAFVVVFLLSRIVSLSSILAAVAFSLAILDWRVFYPRAESMFVWKYAAFLWATCGVVIAKHHSNIRRLLNGTEPKFGATKSVVPTDPIQVEKNA
jgi:acyl phosphate:glycerol-3-phosphate acyltransferase